MADDRRRHLRILVASPGDVDEERKIAVQVINQWNIAHGDTHQLHLDAVLWETHSAPECGERVQGILNEQLAVDHCDCGIGIFWTRIGTDTGVAPGGAVEEIRRMLSHGNRMVCALLMSSGPVWGADAVRVTQLASKVHIDLNQLVKVRKLQLSVAVGQQKAFLLIPAAVLRLKFW